MYIYIIWYTNLEYISIFTYRYIIVCVCVHVHVHVHVCVCVCVYPSQLADTLQGAGVHAMTRGWMTPSDHAPVWASLRLVN
jgi:hypothetical protein